MTATPTDAKIAAICAPMVRTVNPFSSSRRAARQHSSLGTTRQSYRQGDKIRPVR